MEEKASHKNYYHYYYFLLPFLFSFFFIFYLTSGRRRPGRKLPPTPPAALPLLGHIRLLKHPIHRTFNALAKTHGPVFSLRLGTQLAVVISSAAAAEECFTKNDVAFANRPHLIMGKHLEYDNTTITQSPYGDHWRNLRRIGAVEIFSTHRINAFNSIRRQEVHRLVAKLVTGGGQRRRAVELKSAFNQLAFDTMTRMVAGKSFYGGGVDGGVDDAVAGQFREIMKEVAELGGATNAVDFVPVLRWMDGGKFETTVAELAGKMDLFLQGLIEEHKSKKEGLESTNTMIDHLLTLQESDPDYYNDHTIKGFVLVMLLAGTDTNSVTLEWAMSNLLNNPDTLSKARDEIDEQIGHQRLINESDIPNLPYLRGIISETLRLYPAAPLLVPHVSSEDCLIGGYHVPRGTLLLVNAWAIHRDPSLWPDPTEFRPERHGDDGGGKGTISYKLVPFGLGRRACPGAGLAQRFLGLTLGTLIQCFEWERVGEEEVDMSEGKGITMPKEKPLEAVCMARPIVEKIIGT